MAKNKKENYVRIVQNTPTNNMLASAIIKTRDMELEGFNIYRDIETDFPVVDFSKIRIKNGDFEVKIVNGIFEKIINFEILSEYFRINGGIEQWHNNQISLKF